jgi:5-methylcytosine-specific restriction endonuclease McrA
VAHLDHVPENCGDENLRFWCQRCHDTYDAVHRNETRAKQFLKKWISGLDSKKDEML